MSAVDQPLCLDALVGGAQPCPDPWEFDYEAWLGLTDATAPRRSLNAWCRWHGQQMPGQAPKPALTAQKQQPPALYDQAVA